VEWLSSAGLTDPAYALLACIAVCSIATWAALVVSPAKREAADPLSGLFDAGNLDSELAQVAGRPTSAYRPSPVMRAGLLKRAAMAQSEPRPHPVGQREMLAHLAQVLRAGIEEDPAREEPATAPQWEEVLLLPPPSSSSDESIAKAA